MCEDSRIIGSSLRLLVPVLSRKPVRKVCLSRSETAPFSARYAASSRCPAAWLGSQIVSAGASWNALAQGTSFGKEVTGRVHDNQHCKILSSHPQNAEEETRQRGHHDRVPDGHQ
jgi:hypothetical protein